MAVEQVGFKSSMFGFRKVDVLTYIDSMSAEHLSELQKEQARAAALEETVSALTEEKEALNATLSEKKEQIDVLHQALAHQTELAEQAQKKTDDVTEALKNAEASARDYQGRLFAREGEATVLRRDNAKLSQSLTEKENELERVYAMAQAANREAALQIERAQEAAQAEVAAANERANVQKEEMQQVMHTSASNMTQEVVALKQALSALDRNIADSLSDLQRSTQMLSQSLETTEENMQALGVKLEAFPRVTQQGTKKEQDGQVTYAASAKKQPYATPRRKAPTPTISSFLLAKITKMIGEI